MALEFKDSAKDVRGEDISLSEACDGARSLPTLVPYKEKERISKEIRGIIVT